MSSMRSMVSFFIFGRSCDSAVWLAVFNIVFNAYPVMLQRYNRLRLQRLRHEHHHVTSTC